MLFIAEVAKLCNSPVSMGQQTCMALMYKAVYVTWLTLLLFKL